MPVWSALRLAGRETSQGGKSMRRGRAWKRESDRRPSDHAVTLALYMQADHLVYSARTAHALCRTNSIPAHTCSIDVQ
jgi:hypothetical protein